MMKKMKKMNVLPVGYAVKVRPLNGRGGTKHAYEVRHYGKVISEGYGDDAEEARKYAGDALLKHAENASKKQGDKNAMRIKLRALLTKRQYLVAGATELLLAGSDLDRVVEEAEEYEREWQKKDPKGMRKEIPKHHRSLTPTQAARQLTEVLIGLGYLVDEDGSVRPAPKLKKWAVETLGERFA